MRRRTRLALSGALAALAAAACLLYGQSVREEAQRVRTEALERYGGEVVRLVVATEALEAGDLVSRSNVAEREWLVDFVPQGAVTGMDDVLGAELTVPAAAGAPLTSLNFREAVDAVEVPSGTVAISVPATEDLGLPRSVEVGSELSAYGVTDDGVRLIAGSVEVIEAPASTGGLGAAGELTIAVVPEDVASVLSASADGSLRLALPSDEVADIPEEQLQAPTEVDGEGADAQEGDDAR